VWSIRNPGSFVTDAELTKSPEYMEPVMTVSNTGGPLGEMGYHCRSDGPRGNFYVEAGLDVPWIA